MKSNLNPKRDPGGIDPILANEEDLIPSSGFLTATMERVHEEAARPKPIPFPWLRALPGIVVAVAALGWCGFALTRVILSSLRATSLTQVHLTPATRNALEPAEWVAVALAASLLSWLLSRRLAGRSGLL
jgi:hypothetical protein